MRFSEEEVRERIRSCLVGVSFDEEKLSLFVKELMHELVSKGKCCSGLDLTEVSFGESLQRIMKGIREENRDYLEQGGKLLKKIKGFKKDFLSYRDCLFVDGACFYRGYVEEEHISFESRVVRLEEDLTHIESVLERGLSEIAPNVGRPSDKMHVGFTIKMCALSECIFGLKIKNTNNQTDPFYLLIMNCLNLLQEKEEREEIHLPREIAACFDDFQRIYSMAFVYKKYDCLDLFVEHVLRTRHIQDVRETFDEEWEDWEKPSNLNSLSQ